MKKLSAASYLQAADFLRRHARPLDRARFAHEFEGAPARAVLDALAAFRNPDGGFGRALEPDLRMEKSSALATATALDILAECGASHSEPLVKDAFAWLAAQFDPELSGWRCVPPDVDDFPRAPHWTWELHRPGGPWPHALIPGAWLLSHLSRWPELAPRGVTQAVERAFVRHVTGLTGEIGGDSLFYAASAGVAELAPRLRELALANVTRDPTQWLTYSAKPLKLAPAPDSPLAECLADEVALELDWELGQQAPDGSWLPNWSWQDQWPADWERARREWQGEVTLRMLRSLRAWGRIEGL
jgi:hypothetical protein